MPILFGWVDGGGREKKIAISVFVCKNGWSDPPPSHYLEVAAKHLSVAAVFVMFVRVPHKMSW